MPRSDWVNLAGKDFGLLTARYVQSRGKYPSGQPSEMWLCDCACGRTFATKKTQLTSGMVWHCGCVVRSRTALHTTREYRAWRSMRTRARVEDIHLHKAWLSFNQFSADMGVMPADDADAVLISLRICVCTRDYAVGFVPGNAFWGTGEDQLRAVVASRYLTYKGETLLVSEWERRTGIHHEVIWHRVNKLKWTVEEALTTPTLADGGWQKQLPYPKKALA